MKKYIIKFTVIALFFLAAYPKCYAAPKEALSGYVIGVYDGDTITLLKEDYQKVKIRLAQIDAPESKQAFGQKSRQSLADLVFNKVIKVSVDTIDRYGRTVGTLYLGDTNINKIQVQRGMAWVYRQYSKDKTLLDDEAKAKANRLGLWADNNPEAPWDYRKKEKESRKKI